MHESRRSETKQEAGRAALLPPALTSPHGARQLYLGTATVCGAAAPLGHGAECRFSRQQTTTAPSKPLEAAARRPAHRCFDSHSPATTALDSPRQPRRCRAATRWTPGPNFGWRGREGGRKGAGKGSPAPHGRSSSPRSPLASPGTVRPTSSGGSPRGAGGTPHHEKTEAVQRGAQPPRAPCSSPRDLSQDEAPAVGRWQERAGWAQPHEWPGGPARGRSGGSRQDPALFVAHLSRRPDAPAGTRPPKPHKGRTSAALQRGESGSHETLGLFPAHPS